MRKPIGLIVTLVLLAGACLACADDSAVPRRASQRERDSVISTLPIPGAKVVGKALTVSDSAASRASLMDSASQD
jgi:hypothetical protein